MYLQHVLLMFEIDCKIIVDKVNKSVQDESEIVVIVKD